MLGELGARRLDQIRPAHVQALVTGLARRKVAGCRVARPAEGAPAPERPLLSQRTVRYAYALLRAVLEHAVRLQVIRANPCHAVPLPKLTQREPVAWAPEEAAAFLAEAERSSACHALYYLALATGARRGELLALRWGDVDLVDAELVVRATRGDGSERAPKTPRGRRTVSLPDDAVAVLRRHREAQDLAAVAAREHRWVWRHDGHVFTTRRGTPLAERNLLRDFKAVVRRAGVRDVPFHALRHTAATLLLRAGVAPHVVSERLGHADASITLRVYTHVLEDTARAAALPLDELLHGRLQTAPTAGDEVN